MIFFLKKMDIFETGISTFFSNFDFKPYLPLHIFFFSVISVAESAIQESEVSKRLGTVISSELAFPTSITKIVKIMLQHYADKLIRKLMSKLGKTSITSVFLKW